MPAALAAGTPWRCACPACPALGKRCEHPACLQISGPATSGGSSSNALIPQASRVPGTFLIGWRLREERLSQPRLAPGSEGPGGVPDPWVLIQQDGSFPPLGEQSAGGLGSRQGWLASWGQLEAQRGRLQAALVGLGDSQPRAGSHVVGAHNPGDATGTGCTGGSRRLCTCQDFTRAGVDFLRISGVAVFELLGRADAQLWRTPSWLPASVLRQPRDRRPTAPGARSPRHCLQTQCHSSSRQLAT